MSMVGESKRLSAWLAAHENILVGYLSDLIRIPTVNPPGTHYRDLADYCAEILNRLGMDARTIRTPDEELPKLAPQADGHARYNVIAARRGRARRPALHLSGHYDVVPAGAGWTRDPFEPIVEGGRVHGLGSSDQKGGIASVLGLCHALHDLGLELEGELSVSFTPDEETGGFAGMGYLVDQGLVEADMAIITEPSQPNLIKLGHRGALWLRLTTIGRTAHGSMAFVGINAYEKMVKVSEKLWVTLLPYFATLTSSYPTEREEERHPMMMLGGVVRGGVKTNVVPDRCTITIDRRLIPEEELADAYAQIMGAIEAAQREDPDVRVEVETELEVEAASISPESRICQDLAVAHRDVYGVTPRLVISPGFNDPRFLIKRAGIPTVTYGPGILKQAHQPDEYINVEDLVKATQVLGLMTVRTLRERAVSH
jgi:succinyl-diaminopimelate desuccinylase